ncbi:MAG: hypothetical protein EAZ51_06215 [Sphingobacteriales bacterium]|nr:MAG: hypothetical protein EAZ64_03275 [Sphingobacteriales bacterium]TAF80330.1 MAG: hypothetical protein EAZ51_06215 [Sphingobacteriales bacterium]
MKINHNITLATLALAIIGLTVKAQSLDDAKKAVYAEQFVKAKTMFSGLTAMQPTNAENYFYYGDLYLNINKPDSAKMAFQKGIAIDPKFSLNYVGLGAVNLFEKDASSAQVNFALATASMRKKDYKEYIYVGKAFTYEASRDLPKAFEWFTKAKELGDKDVELHIALGNAYKADKKNSDAVGAYQRAMNIQSNLPRVEVNIGEIWTQAYNFDLAESTLKGVIAKDPNFGPAYRALAENYYRWASLFPNKRTDLLPKAQLNYSKYLDLTDRSAESRYRYLIFLLNAGDYSTLEKEASTFIQQYGTKKPEFALAQRFLGYAYIENGKAVDGVKYLNNFMTSVEAKRVIADDYSYLGKAYQVQKQDSMAIINFIKGYNLDTTNTQALNSIAKSYFSSKKFGKAAEYYRKLANLPKAGYADKFYLGYADYFYYATELANKTPKDQALITKTLLEADSVFTFVGEKAKNGDAYLYLARVEYYLEPTDALKKSAKAYDKFIEYTLLKGPVAEKDKKNLVEAYAYLGAEYIKTDKAKAKDYFEKALVLNPSDTKIKEALRAIAGK